jgi:endonuclease/exonuclease/phosphatase family metal-dependent hydrolase
MAAAKNNKRGFSFFNTLLLLANIVVIVFLLAGFFAAFVPPDKNWMMAFVGLAFPYLFIINLLFVPLWLLIKRKYALLPIVFVIICWFRINGYFQIDFSDHKSPSEESIKILSYNVRLFDLYNWKENRVSDAASEMFALMHETKPDLLFIQEYHSGRKRRISISDSIRNATGLEYSHISLVMKKDKIQPYGIATFSRWPIISKGVIRFSGNPANVCIYSDIVRGKDTLRIFNIHLESIQFSKEDYLFVNEFRANTEEQEKFSKGLISISKKLKNAFIQRAVQARKVAGEIEQSPYPVIVCGDFNDTPSSYTYQQISASLEDAFIHSGSGLSQTYAGPLPSFRIDYTLYDSRYFSSESYRHIKKKYSDHFPIISSLKFQSVK